MSVLVAKSADSGTAQIDGRNRVLDCARAAPATLEAGAVGVRYQCDLAGKAGCAGAWLRCWPPWRRFSSACACRGHRPTRNARLIRRPSGQTVTCSSSDADGFQAGAGVTNLTVNVVPGATVNDNGTAAIGVNDSNTVTNGGTLTAGAGLIGINAGSFNNLANNGTITVGNFAAAIAIEDNNTVTNSGTLAADHLAPGSSRA